jgi:hypothetical protein
MKDRVLYLITFIVMTGCIDPVWAEDDYHEIPVVVIKYFPVKGANIDIDTTGDWGESLIFTRTKVDSLTKGIVKTLEEGSRYHAYKNPESKPSLKYKIVKEYEFLEPLPTYRRSIFHSTPITDYNTIVDKINIREWIIKEGVKEVWLWGYHGGVLDLWESNMAGPFGDISNSNRDEDDLPVFNKTYTVYHYNYQRGLSEAIENHMHQIEAVLNYVDGRDHIPEDDWDQLLFWGKFVGSDVSHKIINPGCGWAHYPPNGGKDYDWSNKKYVWTDIEDWQPDGKGKKQKINCDKWNCESLKWFIYWMQSIPGKDNGLEYRGSNLTNWWIFVGDFDKAMKNKIELVK